MSIMPHITGAIQKKSAFNNANHIRVQIKAQSGVQQRVKINSFKERTTCVELCT